MAKRNFDTSSDRLVDLNRQGFMSLGHKKRQEWLVCHGCMEQGTPRSCSHPNKRWKLVTDTDYPNGYYTDI
jgi:hypothetical protein